MLYFLIISISDKYNDYNFKLMYKQSYFNSQCLIKIFNILNNKYFILFMILFSVLFFFFNKQILILNIKTIIYNSEF